MWRIPTDTPQTAVPNGRTKLQEVTPQTPLDDVFAKWNEDGAIVIKNLLTTDQIKKLNEEIAPLMSSTQRGSHLEQAQPFHGRRTKRAGGLANHSQIYRDHVLDNDFVHAICQRNFRANGNNGDYWLSTGTTLTAGGPQDAQTLHRDLTHLNAAVLLGPDFEEVHPTFIIALSRFTEENGATRVIPGSNKWTFDQRGSPDQTVGATMEPGDCLLLGGKVLHGMGENKTTEDRAAMQMAIVPGYFTPMEAHSHVISMDIARKMSKRTQRFLGFRSQYSRGSPGIWTTNYQDLSVHLGLDTLDGAMDDITGLNFDYKDPPKTAMESSA